jgi:hypothetical protein
MVMSTRDRHDLPLFSEVPAKRTAVASILRSMDARELVSLLQLEACPRRLGLAKAQIPTGAIVNDLGLERNEISKLAKENGEHFENRLTKQDGGAKPLRNLYARLDPPVLIEEAEVLKLGANDAAVQATMTRLHDQRGMIVQGRLVFNFAGLAITLEPDILVWDNNLDAWRVGEIKSYAYAGRMTDPGKTASAAAQAAFSVFALQQHSIPVYGRAVDLVFTQAETYKDKRFINATLDSVGIEDVLFGIRGLEERLRSTAPISLSEATVTPVKPCIECRSACPLWEVCGKQLRDQGSVWGVAPNLAPAGYAPDSTVDRVPYIEELPEVRLASLLAAYAEGTSDLSQAALHAAIVAP